jgi:hypothetical protein
MWRYLRSVYDEQSFIDVGGESVQYDILRYENTSDAVDFTEESPHYVMEMVCYVWENVHQRQYTKFPYFKSLDTNVEAIPLSNVSITKTV